MFFNRFVTPSVFYFVLRNLLIVVCLVSCVSPKTSLLSEDAYVINLDNPKKSVFLYSDIFKSAKTIILETNKECLISHIFDIQVYDSLLYVLDASNIINSLFVFDLDGNYVRKIGRAGNGPGEYHKLFNFTLDVENKIIFLLDDVFIHKYKFDGIYIKSISISIPATQIKSIHYYNNILFADVRMYSDVADKFMLFQINPESGKVISHDLPISLNKGWNELFISGQGAFMARLNDPPMYTQIFMDEIVSITDQPKVSIALHSKDLTTQKDIEKITQGNPIEKMNNFMSLTETSKIHNVYNYFEHDNLIFFNYKQGEKTPFVLYNTQNNTVQISEQTKNDLVFKTDPNIFHNFMFFDKHGVYDVLSQPWLSDIQGYVDNDNFNPALDKLDKIKQLKEETNPVIFYYDFW